MTTGACSATSGAGRPGAEITYHLNDARVGGSITFDYKRFRLEEDNNQLPDGVFEDWSIPSCSSPHS